MKKNVPATGSTQRTSNVIDLAERAEQPISAHFSIERLEHLKRRLDVQNGKLAVSTTLLSIVVLVTLANNTLLAKKVDAPEHRFSRGIASVPTGTSDAEDSLVARLAKQDLTNQASVGHKPSDLERFSIGFLEGNYAIQLHDGKLRELQFSQAAGERTPKHIDDLNAFLDTNRSLLPVQFDKSVKVGSHKEGDSVAQTFELVNHLSMPVAKVQFVTNDHGDLLGMEVESTVQE